MFADDTNLTISGKNYFELQNGTNHDLENIRQWLLANKLSLNTTKTEFLIIGSNYNLANLGYSPEIRLGDTSIKRVYSAISLGVYIDDRLSWSTHINHVAKKVSSVIGGLRQIRQFVNDDTLLTIYNSLIQPSFDYCDLVWDNLSKGLATRLQKLQNRAGRVILRAAYDVSSEDVLKELGWSDLKTRRAKHKATQMFKISTGEAPNYLTDRFFKVEARNPYNVRNTELNINLPLPKTDFMKRSFLYAGPK